MGPVFVIIVLLITYLAVRGISRGDNAGRKEQKPLSVAQAMELKDKKTDEKSRKLSFEEFSKEAKSIHIIQKPYDFYHMENDNMEEYIFLNPSGTVQITCYHKDKLTELTTKETFNVNNRFFIMFEPDDFQELLRKTFGNHPCINLSLNNEESENIKETFRIAKEKGEYLKYQLDLDEDIGNPETYSPKKRISFSGYNGFRQVYCPDISVHNGIIVYSDLSYWQDEKRTALFNIHSDDFFKADVYTGYYNGMDFSVSKTTINLPDEFYKYCFIGTEACTSPEKVKKLFAEFPGLLIYSITGNKAVKDIFVKISTDNVQITETMILYFFQYIKENDSVNMWIKASGSERKHLTLPWHYFYAYDVRDLSALLKKEYPELLSESEFFIEDKLKQSSELRGLFENAENKVSEYLGKEYLIKSKEFRRILKTATAYHNCYDDFFNRDEYDRIEGSAVTYNFVRINKGYDAEEAVTQYLYVREAYSSLGECDKNIFYGLWELGTRAYMFEKTIFIVENSEMTVSLGDDFLEKCRRNKIMIMELKNEVYHDYVSEDNYNFEKKTYVLPDHDATSVFRKDLVKTH